MEVPIENTKSEIKNFFHALSNNMLNIKIKIGEKSYKIPYNIGLLGHVEVKKVAVFGYCRVSTDMQGDNESIESQIKTIIAHCSWNSKDLCWIFVDDGLSGKNISDRPGIKAMLKEIENYSVDRYNRMEVHCCYIHRLTRNKQDMNFLCDKLPRLGCELNCYDTGVNIRNGSMILNFLASFSEDQRKTISKNVSNVMAQMSEDGKLISRPKYGYDYFPHETKKSNRTRFKLKYQPNVREQANIQLIQDLYDEDNSLTANSIFNILDKDYKETNYYKEDDKTWHISVIKRILEDYKLSKREITEATPIHLKEEVIKTNIIKLISEGFRFSTTYKFAATLNDMCLFKHKITPDYIKKILPTLEESQMKRIIKNREIYLKKLIKFFKNNMLEGKASDVYQKLADKLNIEGYTTMPGHLWSMYTVATFYNEKIKNCCIDYDSDNDNSSDDE